MSKKFYVIIFSVLLLITSFTGCGTKETSFDGYLIDKHCAEMKDPVTETKMCLTMEKCQASGYGVSVKQDDGKYKFYKFDDKGHDLAKDLLSKTTKEKGIEVVVKGTLEGDSIKVSTISEK